MVFGNFWILVNISASSVQGLNQFNDNFYFIKRHMAAVLIGVLIFSILITKDVSSLTLSEKQEVFKYVIGASSLIVFIIGIVVYTYLKIELKMMRKLEILKVS